MRTAFLLLFPALLLAGCSNNPQPADTASSKPAASAPAGPVTTVDPATAGTVEGTVRFTGTAPKPRKLDMSQDPACNYLNDGATFTPVEGQAGGLANVFVYVKEGLEGKNFAAPQEPVVVDQRGCRYVPHVAGAMVGQTVRFLNSDSTAHNIHPNPQHNREFNESQQPRGKPIEKTFDRPELMMAVKCNQHPWMKMYMNVTAHPFFAVSTEDGKFQISGLPPGEYTVAALHETLGEQTAKVKVAAKETASARFDFQAK